VKLFLRGSLALSYLNVYANNACIDQTAKEFVVAAYIAKSAGIVHDDDAPSDNTELQSLVLDSWWRETQLKARYLQLPKAGRDQIDRINELHQPFDLIRSAEAAQLLGK
jgi:hypothetical protein